MAYQLIPFALLAISFAHCDIVRVDDGFSANFQIINIGRMYETLTPAMQLDLYACAFECIRNLNCLTINHNEQKNLCELVDQIYDEMEADTSDPDWANFGTPVKVDGNFSDWQNVGACSVTCENGTQMEQRKCDNPQPRFGGTTCQGETFRQVRCITDIPCPIDGSWSSWKCSNCTRARTCNAPTPQHNGSCLQSDKRTRSLTEVAIITPCTKCITEYVKCEFTRGQDYSTGTDEFVNHTLKTDEKCIEFCYFMKKKNPTIKGAVVMDAMDAGKCWCKSSIQVVNDKRSKACTFEEVNLVRSRDAKQSSMYSSMGAGLAVDGQLNTFSCTLNYNPSLWSVETESSFVLQNIKLTVSHDLHLYKNLRIEVKAAENNTWEICKSIGSPSTYFIDVKCDEREKIIEFIRIVNARGLILHEVEVYGWPNNP